MSEPIKASVVPTFDKKDIEDNKAVAALSYLWILFLVPLLAKKDSKFCQENAKQGLVLFIVWIVGSFVFWFPIIGWLAAIAVLIANLIALIKTLSGEFWEIPLIGPLRKSFNL